MTQPVAIRVTGVGQYFGPMLEMDGAENPREAWRSLLKIAGLEALAPAPADDQPALSVAPPGHVLRDVSLEIEKGSVVCLTGPAGVGKSVLLRILANELMPTTGRIELYEPVRTLVTPGGALDQMKNALENIQASGAYRELEPDAAARYAADVIAFAELEGLEQVSLRTYSTGMVARLGIAMALCGAPSLVLVDDVLTVGDIGFQRRCVERIRELAAAGCTMVVAFSDEDLVTQIATRVIALAEGRIAYDSAETNARLSTRPEGDADIEWEVGGSLPDDEVVAIRSVEGELARDGDEPVFVCRILVEGKVEGLRCRPVVSLLTDRGVILFRSLFPDFTELSGRGQVFSVRVPTGLLPAGRFTISIATATYRGEKVFASKGHNTITLTIRREQSPAATDARTAGGKKGKKEEPEPLLQPILEWEVLALAATPSPKGVAAL